MRSVIIGTTIGVCVLAAFMSMPAHEELLSPEAVTPEKAAKEAAQIDKDMETFGYEVNPWKM